MKYYATLLNLKEANGFSLDENELFDSFIQEGIADRIILGSGETKYASLKAAVDTLMDNAIIETCACEAGVRSIMTKLHGREALRHLWLHQDERQGETKLYPVPLHDKLVDFCERNNIPQHAQRELCALCTVSMRMDD